MKNLIQRFYKNTSGQALSEYALILALIAVVVVGAVALFGEQISAVFTSLTSSLGGGGA